MMLAIFQILCNMWIDSLRDDYLEAVEGMRDRLLRRTSESNLTYLGELENNALNFKPKMVSIVPIKTLCYIYSQIL